MRRTRAHLFDRPAAVAAAPAVADLLAGELGWDGAETARQVDAYRQLAETETREAGRARPPIGRRRRDRADAADRAARARPPAGRPRWRCRTSCSPTLRDIAPVDRGRAGGRRRQPRLVAAGACTGRSTVRCRRGPAVVVRPERPTQVAADRAAPAPRPACPVTTAGGRSGVCGASVPVLGGVVLDIDGAGRDRRRRRRVRRRRGAGRHVRSRPRGRAAPAHGLTVGHFPQSFDLATVGGWVACRGAGQYSHALRQGRAPRRRARGRARRRHGRAHRRRAGRRRRARTSRSSSSVPRARSASSPRVWLRAHPVPPSSAGSAYWFASFAAGIEACRQILRRGRHTRRAPPLRRRRVGPRPRRRRRPQRAARARRGRPADRRRHDGGRRGVLPRAPVAQPAPVELVDGWMEHRNDTSALQALTRKGFVVDTMEIAAPWSRLAGLFDAVPAAHAGRARTRGSPAVTSRTATSTAPASTSRSPPHRRPTRSRRRTWRCGTRGSGRCSTTAATSRTTTASGSTGPASWRAALGTGLDVLSRRQGGARPGGILNPGKLGLASPFGEVPWPPRR